jgi:rhodanese-related sulfurtransferase
MMLAPQPELQVADCSLDGRCFHALLARGGQLVDVRSPEDFRHSTVPGALNLPLDALSWDYAYLDKRDPVILCGNSPVLCERAAFLLAGRGFSRIYYFCEQ